MDNDSGVKIPLAASGHKGILPLDKVVLQWTDRYTCDRGASWHFVPEGFIGKWADEAFMAVLETPEGRHNFHVYGNLFRLSDAVHPSLFYAKYGRDKPKSLVEPR